MKNFFVISVCLFCLLSGIGLTLLTSCKKDVVTEKTTGNFKGIWNRTSGSATTAIAIGCVKGEISNYIFMCEWDTPYPDEYYGTIDLSTGEIKWQYPIEYQQYDYKAEVNGGSLELYAFVNGSYVSAGSYVKGSWPGNHCDYVQSGEEIYRPTDLTPPTLLTDPASNITGNSAHLSGKITNYGGYEKIHLTMCGFRVYNESGIGDPVQHIYTTISSDNSFSVDINNINGYYKFEAICQFSNSGGPFSGNQVTFQTASNEIPVITTKEATNITSNSATSGVIVVSGGDSQISEIGVCWSTNQNPTSNDNHISSETYNNCYITGLANSTTYYVRAYAVNLSGTAYGNQISFTTNLASVGDNFQGGIVAYIFQQGEPGFVENETHGIIATPIDQSTNTNWGCDGLAIAGADGTILGTGFQNTIDIVNGCIDNYSAAKICYDLVLGGYSDWFLPSNDEFQKLWNIDFHLPGLTSDAVYWTSTEVSAYTARGFNTTSLYGESTIYPKANNYLKVRAIRYF